MLNYPIKKPKNKDEEAYWWSLNAHHMPLNVIREFKDYLDFTIYHIFPEGIPFYDILRCNENIDFDFVREMLGEFSDKIDLKEVMSIIDGKFGHKNYMELLDIWVKWNLKNKTKGYF